MKDRPSIQDWDWPLAAIVGSLADESHGIREYPIRNWSPAGRNATIGASFGSDLSSLTVDRPFHKWQ